MLLAMPENASSLDDNLQRLSVIALGSIISPSLSTKNILKLFKKLHPYNVCIVKISKYCLCFEQLIVVSRYPPCLSSVSSSCMTLARSVSNQLTINNWQSCAQNLAMCISENTKTSLACPRGRFIPPFVPDAGTNTEPFEFVSQSQNNFNL